jgi:hypothetical protein
MYACTIVNDCGESWAASYSTYGILGLNERVVDSNDMHVIMLDGISIDDTPDSSETVDANVSRHVEISRCLCSGSCRLDLVL